MGFSSGQMRETGGTEGVKKRNRVCLTSVTNRSQLELISVAWGNPNDHFTANSAVMNRLDMLIISSFPHGCWVWMSFLLLKKSFVVAWIECFWLSHRMCGEYRALHPPLCAHPKPMKKGRLCAPTRAATKDTLNYLTYRCTAVNIQVRQPTNVIRCH